MIKDMEMECKTKFSTDVEFSFSFKGSIRGGNFPFIFAAPYGIICEDGWYSDKETIPTVEFKRHIHFPAAYIRKGTRRREVASPGRNTENI